MTPEQFLLLADHLPEPMLLLSTDGLILAANRAISVRSGTCYGALRGKNLAELVADPLEDVSHYLRLCSRSRNLVIGGLILRAEGDELFACRTEGALVRPKSQSSKALLLLRLIPKETTTKQFVSLNLRIDELGREVQRRKWLENEAQQQAERLRITLASIGDAVITTDQVGQVTSMNPVAETLTAWTESDAMGQPLEVVFRIFNEQTRETVENPAMRALQDGVVVGLANHTILVAKDGSERPIDDSAAPIYSTAGELIGCILVFRNISERRRAEHALREAEGKRNLALDSAELGAWHVDPDTFALTTDERFQLIFTGQIGPLDYDSAIKLIHEEDRDRVVQAVAAAMQPDNPVPFSQEYRVLLPHDRRQVWILGKGRANFVGAGAQRRLASFDGTVADITERKEMENSLRQLAADLSESHHRKDEFLATLAHELRNPLAPIRNGLSLLQMEEKSTPTTERVVEMMDRQLTQMVRLIDDLMDVSRISRGLIELRKEQIPLETVVSSAMETSRPFIEEIGHKLTVALPSEPITVQADLTRLSQVFLNLLNNAAKYSDPGSHIHLQAQRQGSEVVVSVKDTGLGISAEELPNIFEMFRQVDRSLERSKGGLGIGLTLVKRLVELHNGSVEAHSDGLGQGSEFVVRLPFAAELSNQPELRGETQQLARSALRVLIVDDNKDATDTLAMILEIVGNQIRTAYDGQEGVRVAEEFRPHVILFDIGMPKLNGHEACRYIRQQPWGKNILLIAVTGWGQVEDYRLSEEAGFDHHLVKPIDPDALMKLLERLDIAEQ